MSTLKEFTFSYPVTAAHNNGKLSLISTVDVSAHAYLYRDGSVRTVDITEVKDADGNNIGSWIGFIESSEGNLNEVLEAAAMAHAKGLYEEGECPVASEQPEEARDPFDIFPTLGKILAPVEMNPELMKEFRAY